MQKVCLSSWLRHATSSMRGIEIYFKKNVFVCIELIGIGGIYSHGLVYIGLQ